MGKWIVGAVILLLFVVIAGCGDVSVSDDERQTAEVRATLGVEQTLTVGETPFPTIFSLRRGTALLRVSPNQDFIDITLQTQGLSNVTGATINLGRPRKDGPILLAFGDQFSGFLPPILNLRLTARDLPEAIYPSLQPQANTEQFASVTRAILEGRAYLVITTLTHPEGIIRGQIGQVPFQSVLTGEAVVPSPSATTTASGTATAALNREQEEIVVTLNTQGLTGVQSVTIDVGWETEESDPIFTLFTAAEGALPANLTRSVTEDNFIEQSDRGINSFEDAVNALIGGRASIVIRTTAFPDGEIRGQLIPF